MPKMKLILWISLKLMNLLMNEHVLIPFYGVCLCQGPYGLSLGYPDSVQVA